MRIDLNIQGFIDDVSKNVDKAEYSLNFGDLLNIKSDKVKDIKSEKNNKKSDFKITNNYVNRNFKNINDKLKENRVFSNSNNLEKKDVQSLSNSNAFNNNTSSVQNSKSNGLSSNDNLKNIGTKNSKENVSLNDVTSKILKNLDEIINILPNDLVIDFKELFVNLEDIDESTLNNILIELDKFLENIELNLDLEQGKNKDIKNEFETKLNLLFKDLNLKVEKVKISDKFDDNIMSNFDSKENKNVFHYETKDLNMNNYSDDKDDDVINLVNSEQNDEELNYFENNKFIDNKLNIISNKNLITKNNVDTKMILEQIKSTIKASDLNKHSEIVIKLKPEELGKLEIKLEIHRNTVIANINVENAKVKQALETNLADLKESLKEKGFSNMSLDVNVNQNNENDNGKNQYEEFIRLDYKNKVDLKFNDFIDNNNGEVVKNKVNLEAIINESEFVHLA